jgi:hypothetical protein
VERLQQRQEIQPILDRHCVSCHNAEKIKRGVGVSPHGRTGQTGRPYKLIGAGQVDPKRAYTQSYVALTTSVNPDKNPWMTWLKPRSRRGDAAAIITRDRARSKVMAYIEPGHYGRESQREREAHHRLLAGNLLVPFCGT